MSEAFTSKNIEVYINGSWVDLTPDVLQSPPPRVTGIGIMGDGPLDRVGSAARFSFSLNNSEANSAGILGYYSPGLAQSLAFWTVGLFVRFYVVYDGIYKGIFYGKIDPDGIEVTTGIYGQRDVKVKASNWMRDAENQTVDLLAYQTNLTADDAIQAVVNNMPRAPLATSYQAGTRTFATMFDVTSQKTKAISEINKITLSEFGLTYVRGSYAIGSIPDAEVLVFENRTHRYDNRAAPSNIMEHSTASASYLLLETGDHKLWEDGGLHILESSQAAVFDESDIRNMTVKYGKHIYNRVKLTSYPREVDASPVVLWNLENEITLEAGQTLSGLRSSYRDPNGKSNSVSAIETSISVSKTANANSGGGGTDKTAFLTVTYTPGTSEVEYSLTNSDTATIYVTALSFSGYGVYIYDQASAIV